MPSDNVSLMPDFSKFAPSLITAMEAQTTPPAKQLLAETQFNRLGSLKQDDNIVVLDNGCGYGIVTKCIFERVKEHKATQKAATLKVVCADLQENMVDGVRARAMKENWLGVECKVVDAMEMDFKSDTFTHVFSNFLVQLLPDTNSSLKETYRVLRPGGYTGYTVWSSVGWVPFIQSVIPTFKLPFIDHTLVTPSNNIVLLESLGYVDARVHEMAFSVRYESARVFSEMLGFAMPHIFKGVILDEFVSGLQDKYGKGELEVGAWKALIVTARKPVN